MGEVALDGVPSFDCRFPPRLWQDLLTELKESSRPSLLTCAGSAGFLRREPGRRGRLMALVQSWARGPWRQPFAGSACAVLRCFWWRAALCVTRASWKVCISQLAGSRAGVMAPVDAWGSACEFEICFEAKGMLKKRGYEELSKIGRLDGL